MSKVPKVSKQAWEESMKFLTELSEKVLEKYKTPQDEDKCKGLIKQAMLSQLEILETNQPVIYGWLARTIALIQITNAPLNDSDLILFILTFYKALKVQEELDDVEGMFENF